ncbi:hypothetical protein BHE74_00056824 [Ensete ventricosum]|nr:hypothetical protein BHE74_00056824 [Ensete ventricosum]
MIWLDRGAEVATQWWWLLLELSTDVDFPFVNAGGQEDGFREGGDSVTKGERQPVTKVFTSSRSREGKVRAATRGGEATEEAEEIASLHRVADDEESARWRKKAGRERACDCCCNGWSRGGGGGRKRGLWLLLARAAAAVVVGGEEWLAATIGEESRAAARDVRLLRQRRRKRIAVYSNLLSVAAEGCDQ